MLETALLCLALNVYHEARGEMIPGQYAVALVTMNRAKGDPARVCPVVTKPKQFSWTIDKLEQVKNGWRLKRSGLPKETHAWDRAVVIARMVLTGQAKDFTGGATHYHHHDVRPVWRLSFEKIGAIGRHVFYRQS